MEQIQTTITNFLNREITHTKQKPIKKSTQSLYSYYTNIDMEFKESSVDSDFKASSLVNKYPRVVDLGTGSIPLTRTKENTNIFLVNHLKDVVINFDINYQNICGLVNVRNTCYINSVLQCLLSTPPLVNFILAKSHKCEMAGKFCMLCEMKFVCNTSISKAKTKAKFYPQNIVNNILKISPNLRPYMQEDSHEFLLSVIEAMHTSSMSLFKNLDFKSETSEIIYRIFGGYLQSKIKCSECHNKSNTVDFFLDLSLDINNDNNIESALRRFTAPELLDSLNSYFCYKCEKTSEATKTLTVNQIPNVMIIHLKRFELSNSYDFFQKISKQVKFSREIDMLPYLTNPETCLYDLFAVIVHHGNSLRSGHYIAYIKSPLGIWFRADDDEISVVGIDEVLASQAYILFYVRKGDPKEFRYLRRARRELNRGTEEKLSLGDMLPINSKKEKCRDESKNEFVNNKSFPHEKECAHKSIRDEKEFVHHKPTPDEKKIDHYRSSPHEKKFVNLKSSSHEKDSKTNNYLEPSLSSTILPPIKGRTPSLRNIRFSSNFPGSFPVCFKVKDKKQENTFSYLTRNKETDWNGRSVHLNKRPFYSSYDVNDQGKKKKIKKVRDFDVRKNPFISHLTKK